MANSQNVFRIADHSEFVPSSSVLAVIFDLMTGKVCLSVGSLSRNQHCRRYGDTPKQDFITTETPSEFPPNANARCSACGQLLMQRGPLQVKASTVRFAVISHARNENAVDEKR